MVPFLDFPAGTVAK